MPYRPWHQRALDLVFPPRCVGCRRPGAWICPRCWNAVRWLSRDACPMCGMESAAGTPCEGCIRKGLAAGGLDPVEFRAVTRFEGVARSAVHELKYSGHFDIASVLGPLMALAGLPEDAVLVPVPLHPARQRARGYNQSRLLAEQLAKNVDGIVVHNRLRRTRKTLDQISLDTAGRRTNVAGAFEWRGEPIPKPIILVDDVFTTGATIGACVDALRRAHMHRVQGVVFACAYHPADHPAAGVP